MLSAIGVVFVGFALAVWFSVRRNRAAIAAGRGGYTPPPGTIGWGESAASSAALAASPQGVASLHGETGNLREAREAREPR